MGYEMKPGDIGFAHTTGIIGKAIRVGEALRGNKNGAKWNHAFLLSEQLPDGDWLIIQAEAHGVTCDKRLSQVAPNGHYEIIPLPNYRVKRENVMVFANQQVGTKYGIVTILSCVLDILLPDAICLRRANTWICSGLVAASLMFGGWWDIIGAAKQDIYTITPAELHDLMVNQQV